MLSERKRAKESEKSKEKVRQKSLIYSSAKRNEHTLDGKIDILHKRA